MKIFRRKSKRAMVYLMRLIPFMEKEDLGRLIGSIMAAKMYRELRSEYKEGEPILIDPIIVRMSDGSTYELPDQIMKSMARALNLIMMGEKNGSSEVLLWSWRPGE